jgi:hypothetical protein
MTSAKFVEWLGGLLEAPLPGPTEGDAWFVRREPFLDRLDEVPGPDAAFLHFVHHSVADVDIRSLQEYTRTGNGAGSEKGRYVSYPPPATGRR